MKMIISGLKKMTAVLMAVCLFSVPAFSADNVVNIKSAAAEEGDFTLDKVVILSRHNIRSPLSTKGSVVDDLCAHEWFKWTSNPGELSLRGAMLETTMGQYFRLWLEKEGLFPENYIPEEGAVRFYANGLQRTQATARYFSAGLLPVAPVQVERKVGYDEMDDTFLPKIYFLNDDYARDALAEVYEKCGGEHLEGLRASLDESFQLVADVTDMKETEAFKSGQYGNFLEDESTLSLELLAEPKINGPFSKAVSLADALVLQYYEEPDDVKAAFGHDLDEEDWKKIGLILKANLNIRFGTPLLALNESHLMLEELLSEMNTEERKFTFLCGHDSTISSVLTSLGAEDYTLPGAIEPLTPIGVKLVFERWVNAEDEAFYKVNLVYQSVDQLRTIQPLTLETPPMIVPVHFQDAEADGNEMIDEEALLGLLTDRIASYYELEEIYGEVQADEAA